MKKTKNAKVVFSDFARGTSCHGIARVHESQKQTKKLFWIILIITVLGTLIWQISDRFNDYFKYETNTQNTAVFRNSLQFPSISICNLNRYFYVTGEERRAFNTLSRLYDYGRMENDEDEIEAALQFFQNERNDFNFSDFVLSKTWDLDPAIIHCSFGQKECGVKNFTRTFTSSLGMCWTFQTESHQTKRGVQHGLLLILNVSQDGYSEETTRRRAGAGIVVQVHAGYEPATPDINGLTAGVGSWGSISIHQQQKRNMQRPWGQCRPKSEKLQFSTIYSVAACFKECSDKVVVDSCKCRDPVVQHYSSIRECTAEEVLLCAAIYRYSFDLTISPSECGCYQACRDVIYNTGISYSTYPSLNAARELKESENLSLEYLRENAVGLSVYYDQLTFTQTLESKAISESALLSDVGGQLGLWIGMSVITLFEFFQLFYRLGRTYFYKQPTTTVVSSYDKNEEKVLTEMDP